MGLFSKQAGKEINISRKKDAVGKLSKQENYIHSAEINMWTRV